MPYVPPLLRHPPPRGRLRHPDGAKAPGPQERADDHGLHTRPYRRPRRRGQPRRPPPGLRSTAARSGEPAPLDAPPNIALHIVEPSQTSYRTGTSVTGPSRTTQRWAAPLAAQPSSLCFRQFYPISVSWPIRNVPSGLQSDHSRSPLPAMSVQPPLAPDHGHLPRMRCSN